MQRGRLGGIPLPRIFRIRDGGIGSVMVVRYSREGRERRERWPVLKKSTAPAIDHPRKGRGSQASTPGGNVINPTYNQH